MFHLQWVSPKLELVVLGCCRQDSLSTVHNVSCIKNELSYPHYTSEMIQIVDYCLNNNLSTEEAKETFRTPILTNNIKWKPQYYSDIINSDIVILEIASRSTYKIENRYVHHILYDDPKFNGNTKEKVITGKLTNEEIHADIIHLRELLKRPIIIIGHLVTEHEGKRYELLNCLREICKKEGIVFIDPIKELRKRHSNLKPLFLQEHTLAHYSDIGHRCILEVYKDVIDSMYL